MSPPQLLLLHLLLLLLLLLLILGSASPVAALEKEKKASESESQKRKPRCLNNMPLRDRIQNSSITASSHKPGFPPRNIVSSGNQALAWCPEKKIQPNSADQWVQFEFDSIVVVSIFKTSPWYTTADVGTSTKNLLLQYKRQAQDEYRNYTLWQLDDRRGWQSSVILKGNSDLHDRRNYITMLPELSGRYFRVRPFNHDTKPTAVCLSVEPYGCGYASGVVAYSAPVGDRIGGVDFTDFGYDGKREGDRLIKGVGQLVDGRKGDESPSAVGTLGLSEFVGWSSHRHPTVDLLFEFDHARRFNSVSIEASNAHLKQGVGLFKKVRVEFSLDGQSFDSQVAMSVPRDTEHQFSRPVKMQLGNRTGRFVRISLESDPEYQGILIAEVTFDSVVVPDGKLPPPPTTAGGGGGGGGGGGRSTTEVSWPATRSPPISGHGGQHVGEPIDVADVGREMTYIIIIVSILATAVLLLSAIGFLCLRRRRLKKQRFPALKRHQQHQQQQLRQQQQQQQQQQEHIHLDFGNGRPAVMMLNGKQLHCGSVYTSLPNSEDGDLPLDDSEANADAYAYAAGSFAPLSPREFSVVNAATPATPAGPVAAGEYASASLLLPAPAAAYVNGLGTYATPRTLNQRQLPGHAYAPYLPTAGTNSSNVGPARTLPAAAVAAGVGVAASSTQPPPLPAPRTPADSSIRGPAGNSLLESADGDLMEFDTTEAAAAAAAAAAAGDSSDAVAPELLPAEAVGDRLRVREQLGTGDFGSIHLGHWQQRQVATATATATAAAAAAAAAEATAAPVCVKQLRADAPASARRQLLLEARLWSRVRDRHCARLLAVVLPDDDDNNDDDDDKSATPGNDLASLATPPRQLVSEWLPLGDLQHHLQQRQQAMPVGCVVHLAEQLAAALQHLQSLRLVHRDVACRNCLLAPDMSLKLADSAVSRQRYAGEYCRCPCGCVLPLRWAAWETVLSGHFSSAADAWSFAVALWEMLGGCRLRPFAQLADAQVVENARRILVCDGSARPLPRPPACPQELFDLMCECWQRDPACRPAFAEIRLFLRRKNLGCQHGAACLLSTPPHA